MEKCAWLSIRSNIGIDISVSVLDVNLDEILEIVLELDDDDERNL